MGWCQQLGHHIIRGVDIQELGTRRWRLLPYASLCASFCVPLTSDEASSPIQQSPHLCSICGNAAPYPKSITSWSLPLLRQNPPGVRKRSGLCAAWKCIRPTAEDLQIMSCVKPEVNSFSAPTQVLPASYGRFPVGSRGGLS